MDGSTLKDYPWPHWGIDNFLDKVLVMADEEEVKRNRLALLKEVKETLSSLGNLERVEGVTL